jgi:sialic acid synthase SpsE
MATLAETFGVKVGYSDHTRGISIPIAAAARGATVIEKHMTLDRTMAGPDHAASLEPDEFRAMVSAIRDVERALGSAVKEPGRGELATRRAARKAIVARRSIGAGEPFSAENLAIKRAGEGGLAPIRYWDLLGQPAPRAFRMDEIIEP